MRLPLVAVSVGVVLALVGLAVPHGGYLVIAGGCFALAGFLRALALTVGRRPSRPDPYAIGFEEGNSVEGSVEHLRELVRLGEERVERASPHEISAAMGVLSGYRAALARALPPALTARCYPECKPGACAVAPSCLYVGNERP